MGYCANCGKELLQNEAFCSHCGASAKPAENTVPSHLKENSLPEPKPSDSVVLCEDGTYRWAYDFHLLKNPGTLYLMWKILGGVMLGIYIIDVVTSFNNSWFTAESFFTTTKMYLFILLGAAVLFLAGYLIYAAIMGGKYCVVFEMNDEGIHHIQILKQFKKAQIIGMITAMAGLAAGDLSAAGAGLLAAAKSSSYSRFKNVSSVSCNVKRNTIKVNELLSKNQIYCGGKDFEFVRGYIVSRCVNAKKIKG